MWNRNRTVFLGCGKEPQDAKIVVWGAPFDSTTSNRPGARFASAVMRSDSWGLETFSPSQQLDLDADALVCDAGDLELSIGNAELALEQVEGQTAGILGDGKIPVMIGGEHLVTLGAVRAAPAAFPELRVICFDAHADLRDDYMGARLSHACVMRRCWELVGDGRVYQFGVRSGERGEFEFAEAHTSMARFGFGGLAAGTGAGASASAGGAAASAAGGAEARPASGVGAVGIAHAGAAGSAEAGIAGAGLPPPGCPVYLTVDLDVLDPSELPGTGTPEAGGARFGELLGAALAAIRRYRVVALDVVELCPPCDPSGASVALACKLLRELLIGMALA